MIIFLLKLNRPWCFGDIHSENKRLAFDKHCELISESNNQWMNSEKKVHTGSIMHWVLHTVGQIYSSETIFHSISVHVSLVSYL